MWSYFGSKSKIVGYYPPPKQVRIIEPFCGSARYSLKYWENDICLFDKYDVVIGLWKWLQQCSPQDILGLPVLTKGDKVSNYPQLTKDEKTLLGFLVQGAQGKPANSVGTLDGIDVEKDLKRIAKNLFKIKHWKIELGSYEQIKNENATWFIDPPYQFGGQHQYKHSNKHIDFVKLSGWCKSRTGQVIVCENTKADWMNFKPMVKHSGANNTNTTEAIWSNLKTNYDYEQTSLF